MSDSAMRVGLVGPLSPPSGGMANQTQLLSRLMANDGKEVIIVQTNAPYRPAIVAKVPVMRAMFRLIPYMFNLVKMSKRVDVVHIMANSGWSWHLFVAPSVWIAKLLNIPSVINYHGGEADTFFSKSIKVIRPTMLASAKVIVPSNFLVEIFNKYNIETNIVPNAIDLSVFNQSGKSAQQDKLNILVARNLELIYDNETAIKAFHLIKVKYPYATLTVAGTGPEKNNLQRLVAKLDLSDAVNFVGRVDRYTMADLFKQSQVMINPSTADNMPISILESLASGVPVVTTNVGGIPHLVENEQTAMMVQPKDHVAMSDAIIKLVQDTALRDKLIKNGIDMVKKFTWSSVSVLWDDVYQRSIAKVN